MSNGSIINSQGKVDLLNRGYKSSPDYNEPNQIKIGISNGTPNVANTDLTKPIPISGTEQLDDCDTADWSDNADMTSSANTTTYKEGTGSLNLEKDGTATAIASLDKTVTSVDFTSKDIWLWFYIKDSTAYGYLATTDCLTIRFGSDNSNYYEYTRDKSNLASGWNAITFNTATADSVTGSPVITACDYAYLAYEVTGAAVTTLVNDFIMDEWKVASSDDYFKGIDSGYPSIDESAREVEHRYTIPTTDANGYDINGMGVFNDDTSPRMVSEDTFDSESKSNTDEFVFNVKDRIE